MTRNHDSETSNRTGRTLGVLALAGLLAIPNGVAMAAPENGSTPPNPAVDELISALEGAWAGDDNQTPFGEMPFTALFEWTENGLHSRSPLNSETYIDLRFEKDPAGRWILHEEAAMEGLGVQRYSLVPGPDSAEAGIHRWVWEQDPEFLSIDVGVIAETLRLDVRLRGEPHVAFRLDRQPAEARAEIKRQMLAQAELSPKEGVAIGEVVSKPPAHLASKNDERETEKAISDPIEQARTVVTSSPENAEAHLALARLLGQAIDEKPANGPRYAFEMLSALETAVALDPQLAEAYHYLVGYYLNAPPIAGGSTEKAEATARALAEFDAEGSARLLSQIAAQREHRGPTGGSL